MRPGSRARRERVRAAADQSRGCDRLSDAEYQAFERVNNAYRAKFGFPYIVCVRRHTKDSILRDFERRLPNDVPAETTDTTRTSPSSAPSRNRIPLRDGR